MKIDCKKVLFLNKYFSLDGDKIGSKLEYLIIQKDETGLSDFSKKISLALQKCYVLSISQDYRVIFAGGDNMLFWGNDDLSICQKMQDIFRSVASVDISIGIGDTMIEAYLALKIVKAMGGSKILDYGEANRA